MDGQMEKALDFFKGNNKYHRILVEMASNYRSRGTIGGTISLKNLSSDEKLLLCKIDSKYIDAKDARFSVRKFIKTFENTIIEGVDFHRLLEEYFSEKILTNRSVREDEDAKREKYFNGLVAQFSNTQGGLWLMDCLTKKEYGYSIIIREYNIGSTSLKDLLANVITAVNLLNIDSRDYVRLAIFASNVTKDPHYFDVKNIGGKLFLAALAYIGNVDIPVNSEAENELLFRFGIIKDEVSNFTTCANILGYTKQGVHGGIQGFYEAGEPVQLNLYNLSQLAYLTCTNDILYVFENPSVFSEVLAETSDIKASLLCTSGQLKLASLVLLDKVVDKVDKIYYSGDFDPEGINIAIRLKQRYGNKLMLWKYDTATYKRIISDVEFNDKRLKQLDKVDDLDLVELVDEIRKSRKCAYQELLVGEYVEDIKVF